MNLRLPVILPTFVALLFAAGCAATKPAVTQGTSVAAPVVAVQAEPAITISSTGRLANAITAVVNDELITWYEVVKESQPVIREAEKKGVLDDASRKQIRRMVLDRLVEKKLVDQKIRELNVKVTEEEIRQAIDDVKKQNNMPSQEALVAALATQGLSFDQYRAQLQEQIERLKLISMEVRAKIHVSEFEMREQYTANPAKYSDEETYRARHIFFRITDKSPADDIKKTMTTALMVLAEAKGGKDFSELAKTYSEDPAARKDGGDLGSFKRGDMQAELENTMVAMKPGDVSELVYTPVGFHIIKLEERASGKLKPFEAVKAEIEESVYRKKSEERFSQWAKDLRGKASVEIRELNGLL
ncbi:MAG TPA: peptidylprolyl isomerase [Desulfuromonadales bacterium]|nr:peptidylprolyl isomerase [Desulfuromonadales bacterium]